MTDKTNDEMIINTQGGPVINGGTFAHTTFVAHQYVAPSSPVSTPVPLDVEDAEVVVVAAEAPAGGQEPPSAQPPLPGELETPEAQALMAKFLKAGLLDIHFRPVGLSNAQKGYLAKDLADRLNLAHRWQVFGKLWAMKPETLRASFNKSLDQQSISAFIDRLKRID